MANVSKPRDTAETLERNTGFDLHQYARRSFGVHREPPAVALARLIAVSARDANSIMFQSRPDDYGEREWFIECHPEAELTLS